MSIQDFTLNFIKKLPNLRTLRLEFTHCPFIKDEHLNVITKTLQSRLHSLESFELLLEGLNDSITSKAIENLWKSLDTIPNLKRLDLIGHFRQNIITKEIFSTLCDVIQRKCETLLALTIDLDNIEIKYNSYKQLCKILVKMLPKLQSLALRFLSVRPIEDKSLLLFGDLFSKGSNSLRVLDLQFGSDYNITTKGAQKFAERIRKGRFPMVKNLVIKFVLTDFVNYYALYNIAEAIPVAFPNLKHLVFLYSGSNARGDPKVTEKATAMLKERLKNLPEQFRLNW